jgi:membrane protease YdiL (CAAX protease family)
MTEALDDLAAPADHPAKGCLVGVVYVAMGFAWFFLSQIGFAIALAGGVVAVVGVSNVERVMNDMMPLLMVVTGFAGTGGMAVMGVAMARLAGWPVSSSLALRRAPALVWVAAVPVGFTVGWMPGWIVEQLLEVAPWLSLGNLEMLAEAVENAGPLGLAGMAFSIAILAPVFEEAVFRGALWGMLERSLPPAAVWVITSLLFALIHMDPVHVIGVTFTGFILGWVRWMGGSIWPCIAVHFINNAMGVAVMAAGYDPGVTLVFSGSMGVLTLLFATLAFVGRRRAVTE